MCLYKQVKQILMEGNMASIISLSKQEAYLNIKKSKIFGLHERLIHVSPTSVKQ